MHVSSLHIYPIKSCAGTALAQAQVGKYGLEGDRAFMLVDADNRFLTQREAPRMALIVPQWDGATLTLTLTAPGLAALQVPAQQDGPRRTATIWRNTVIAADQGDLAAAWLSEFLQQPVRLVGKSPEFTRPLNPQYAPRPSDETAFADGYPVLLISQASLDALNDRLIERGHEPMPMNRFRPNIVVAGASAFAEDGWQRVGLGQILFDVVKPCPRCVMTTVNQDTGIMEPKEPLATMATFRTQELGVMFGQNLVHANTGTVAVGDAVNTHISHAAL